MAGIVEWDVLLDFKVGNVFLFVGDRRLTLEDMLVEDLVCDDLES